MLFNVEVVTQQILTLMSKSFGAIRSFCFLILSPEVGRFAKTSLFSRGFGNRITQHGHGGNNSKTSYCILALGELLRDFPEKHTTKDAQLTRNKKHALKDELLTHNLIQHNQAHRTGRRKAANDIHFHFIGKFL